MKSFFEEYGLVILGILAVIVLIVMMGPLGDSIKAALTSIVGQFTTQTSDALTNGLNKLPKASLGA